MRFSKGDLGDFINFLKREAGHGKKQKIIKTIPANKQMREDFTKLTRLAEEAELALNRHEAFKKFFWSKVETELEIYNDMRYNRKTNEIEVYDDADDDDPNAIEPGDDDDN